MMGAAVSSLDVPITKGVCGVLAFGKTEVEPQTQLSLYSLR